MSASLHTVPGCARPAPRPSRLGSALSCARCWRGCWPTRGRWTRCSRVRGRAPTAATPPPGSGGCGARRRRPRSRASRGHGDPGTSSWLFRSDLCNLNIICEYCRVFVLFKLYETCLSMSDKKYIISGFSCTLTLIMNTSKVCKFLLKNSKTLVSCQAIKFIQCQLSMLKNRSIFCNL